ncbi:MAG: tRNA epoxyqueuosine(34) reductase QueG [Bacillota bacterium]
MKGIKNETSVKERTRHYAEKIGLPLLGIASPEPLFHLYKLLEERKRDGLDSPFEKRWKPESRCRPDLLLPSVRSIICVGMPYYSQSIDNVPSLWGVSRFARGRDYHMVLKEKLELLAEFLGDLTGPGFEYRAAVDSVPLVERALAHRAGLGWYGKNNLLINPDYGSWFVIGELLTNIPLEPDAGPEENCGDCELCLKACPTGALVEPYKIDAKKCLSCLTQVKEPVPAGLREKFGGSIFGCDICQEVCPKNRQLYGTGKNVETGNFTEFLTALFDISEIEFKGRYGTAGFAWVGTELLRRNAALVLGCKGKEEYIPVLAKALTSPSPQVRSHGAWALAHMGGEKTRKLLEQHLALELDGEVKREIKKAIECV